MNNCIDQFHNFCIETENDIFRSVVVCNLLEHELIFPIAAKQSLGSEWADDDATKTFSHEFICLFQHSRRREDIHPPKRSILKLNINRIPIRQRGLNRSNV